jgi:hypothetical protein
MSTKKNTRIQTFQKISGYLLWFTKPTLAILTIFLIFYPFKIFNKPSGSVSIDQFILLMLNENEGFSELLKSGTTFETKILLTLAMTFTCALLVYIFYYLQNLLKCFHEGEIFNKRALNFARKAYFANLIYGLLAIGSIFVSCVYFTLIGMEGNYGRYFIWIYDSLGILIEIGFFTLILWALEIGTDLKEEAELTI